MFAKIPDIYSCKNDFIYTGIHNKPCFFQDVLDSITTTVSAGERDGTIGAVVITPVLDLQKRARSVTGRVGGYELVARCSMLDACSWMLDI